MLHCLLVCFFYTERDTHVNLILHVLTDRLDRGLQSLQVGRTSPSRRHSAFWFLDARSLFE